jgi:cytochrome c oxidase cbb3-type subunit 3
MKRLFSTLITLGLAIETMAQSAEPAPGSFLNDPLLPVYITAGAILLLLILVVAVAIYTVRVLNVLTEEAARSKAEQTGVEYRPTISWWQQIWERMNASVPVEQEKDIELDHSYDGIRELDNHLPPWWKWLFYGSIAFSVVYLIVYHVTGTLPLSGDEYKRELAVAEDQVRRYLASQPQAVIDENTLEYTADPEAIEKGKTVFINNNCGGCHRNDGGGNAIGPNITDEYWLHGGSVKDIFVTIRDGVVEKGMPAWGKTMSAQDVKNVTFFVMSLQGTNPPDAKKPQGELFKPATTSSDTVKVQAGL